MRKVLIEKVGSTTRVTAWDTKIPDKKVIKSYSQGANTLIENDVLIIEDSNDIFPKQRILFSELDENYGTTDIESFGVYLNENGFFLVSGGAWSELTDFDSLPDADLPLLGTEQIAIVQDGETKKVAVSEFQTDVSGKLDKDTTAGVERAYIINADGSQGTKATSEFKDVLEFADFDAFPTIGESGKIYMALDTNKTYRWSGSAYVQIGGTAKKTENLFFQDAVGSTVRTITADQKNMHQSRFLANASPFGQLGLTLGNGIPETGGVINLAYLSDVITPQITGNYTGKVKKIVFSYSRNVNESTANTNVMIRVMADTKYGTDMQLIAEHNLVSTTTVVNTENKVEIPVLTHLPLSAFSNIGWCIRSNNATAQQFGRIKINVIVEEV